MTWEKGPKCFSVCDPSNRPGFLPYANNKGADQPAHPQSDQHLCCSLPRYYNTATFYIQNFKPLASRCNLAGQLRSYLVGNPEDRFSRDVAHLSHDMGKGT